MDDLKVRSTKFAHQCVKLTLSLPNTMLGNHIKGQLIRCSTSTAANYRAANLGQTKKSFISKLSIVVEETDECIFWIEFLLEEDILPLKTCESILNEAKELTAIFISSRKTAEKNKNR